jgi:hypothetical protein
MRWSSNPDPDHRMSPTEALHAARRACQEAGLPDMTGFTEELIRWVARGSLTTEAAIEWVKVFSRQPYGPTW